MKVTAMDIYKLLPKTNCEDCGEASCMAFATKLSEKETDLKLCTPLDPEGMEKLEKILAPAVREVTIGKGDKQVIIGGDEVLYRYELTYYNPTALVIDVHDELEESELEERIKIIENTEFERTGELLTLDAIAVRNKSGDRQKFIKTVSRLKNSVYPLILCTMDPDNMKAALEVVGDERPLIYAATENNLEEMAKLALDYQCPVALFVPGDLEKMKQLSHSLRSQGIKDIVLDPGTFVGDGIGDTLDNFVMIRRLAVEEKDEDFRFPIMGIPALMRLGSKEDSVTKGIKEATVA
ncbi:MAG: acetyl-CoA decarbonylase/synthase complex subunit gamma, partial [Euryarchaeota archaeon]|nr:acetyl-CoA decarbonylase/synthase complex subunit gamma [Euryarchaeota archaeon]